MSKLTNALYKNKEAFIKKYGEKPFKRALTTASQGNTKTRLKGLKG